MKKITLLFTLLFTVVCFRATAATVTWDGGAGTNNWNDALNWDTDALPTSADDVDLDGNTVVLTASTTVQRVNAGGSSNLTINTGVTLTIDGFSGDDDGLEVQNSASCTNNGTIAISNISGGTNADGLYNKGTFVNNGAITINSTGGDGIYAQDGIFTNSSGATISITNVTDDHIVVDDNSGSFATFNNDGTITITMVTGDDGLYVNDGSTFNNSSVINLSAGGGASTDESVYVEDGGILNNLSGGTITVSSGTDYGLQTKNGGVVNNAGTITIDQVPDHQLWMDASGTFTNTGIINLNNSTSGKNALYVTDACVFTNEMSGQVNITNAANYSIQIDANSSTAEIVNNGTISITGGSNDGIRLQEIGKFTNNSTGVLNITNAGDEGIQIDDGAMPISTFNNSGMVNITNATDHGMELFGTFNNLAGGTYKAVDCTDDGIRMRNAGVFNNDGAIAISGSGSDDIETDGLAFTNTANATFAPGNNIGELEVRDGLDLGTATVTFEITGTTHTTEFDRIEVVSANTLTVTGATMHLDWGAYIPDVGDKFKVIDGSTSNPGTVSGPFANITTSNSDIVISVSYAGITEVEIEVTAIVPVEMTYFIGNKTAEGNLLQWETATELINEGFEIHKSIDGKNWETIAFIAGNGTTIEVSNYEFLDENADNVNYYRLKQLDFDGVFEYSKTILISGEAAVTNDWKTYPNPVTDKLTIEGFQGNITVYNILGQPLKMMNMTDDLGSLSLEDLENGQYIIEMISNDGVRTVRQIVKMKL